MNKYGRMLAILFALPSISLFSEETVQATDNKCAQPTVAQQPSAQPVGVMPQEQKIATNPTITPSLAPHVADGTDTYFNLDFIWWKAVVGGMEYAYTGVVDSLLFTSGFVPLGGSTGEGRVQKPAFTFEPGFKAGMGVNFDHDGWDLFAQYTFLSSFNETNHLSASSGVGERNVLQTVTNNVFIPELLPLTSASCKWKQSFNVIDLELGRDYFISRYLTLRPSAGLKTGWITEQTKVNYTVLPGYSDEQFPPQATNNYVNNILLTYRQNMWGLGVRTALNAGWHFTKNWAIYNDFAFSALWSDFHIHQKQNLTGSVVGEQTTLHTQESFQTVIPVLEAGLGLSCITWWDSNRYRFEFRAGWEQQIWLDFNHYMTLGGTGNLSLQGLTLKTMLNF